MLPTFEPAILEQVSLLLERLRAKNLKLSTAESCTGGALSALLTEIPGGSDVFECGFVTYSNESKRHMLNVSAETIENYGAVSPQTAQEMAAGAVENSGSGIAVSITGIAGPGGGSLDKPVGLVYIGLCKKSGEISSHKFNFTGDRHAVRLHAIKNALKIIYEAAA